MWAAVLLLDGVSEAAIESAARALADGQLVVFPTETVYGLGADGLNPKAAARIFAVKGRPADHPVILHVANAEIAKSLAAQWPDAAEKLATNFWPGPMTLVVKRASHVPDVVTGGQDTVGVRVPSHPVARRLLSAFAAVGSGVIAAPSANRFGAVSPTRAADVIADIGDRLSANDMVMDGGACDVGVESTIVDLSSGVARILRPGGISRAAIAKCLGKAPAEPPVAAVPRVSGSLESHYAPRARVLLADCDQLQAQAAHYLAQHPGHRLACLKRLAQISAANLSVVSMPMDAAGYAQELYAKLHDLDRQGFDALLIEMPPAEDAWEAVRDRLKRAAAP